MGENHNAQYVPVHGNKICEWLNWIITTCTQQMGTQTVPKYSLIASVEGWGIFYTQPLHRGAGRTKGTSFLPNYKWKRIRKKQGPHNTYFLTFRWLCWTVEKVSSLYWIKVALVLCSTMSYADKTGLSLSAVLFFLEFFVMILISHFWTSSRLIETKNHGIFTSFLG